MDWLNYSIGEIYEHIKLWHILSLVGLFSIASAICMYILYRIDKQREERIKEMKDSFNKEHKEFKDKSNL